MGFGGFALLGKEEPIYISDWRTPQLLSTDVTLHCNYMGCFVRRCTAVNLTLFFTSKGSLALDAGMLHVKTHLDDVINGNNSHPYALQSSTGRAECRGCRCEFLRLVLRRGLLHFAWIWYSHGNRRSNLAPISCPTGFGAWTPPPWTGREYRTIIEEKKKKEDRSGGLMESWNSTGLTANTYNYLIYGNFHVAAVWPPGVLSLYCFTHTDWTHYTVLGCVCLSVFCLFLSLRNRCEEVKLPSKESRRRGNLFVAKTFQKDRKFKRLGGNSKSTARRRQ